MHILFDFKRKIKCRVYHVPNTILLGIFLLGIKISFPVSAQDMASSGVKASVSNSLNCVNSSATLIGSSDKENVTFRWEGPNGYLSMAKESVTTIPGNYTLVSTDLSSGKTSTASVMVKFDTIAPVGVAAEVSGDITCRDTLVTLKGKSSTNGVTYTWEGPKGFSSKEINPGTALPGFYKLTVTNSSNGCSSMASVHVQKNVEKPKEVSIIGSGTLTCQTTTIPLKGASSTKNVAYSWSGPDFTAESMQVNVAAPGAYKVTVTDPVNGCASEANVIIKQDIVPPKDISITVADTLNCRKSMTNVKVVSSDDRMICTWSGPADFTSAEKSFDTYIPGSYTMTMTDPDNGCSTKREVQVVQDTIRPNNIILMSSGKLTCTTQKVILSGEPHLPDLVYDWNGPDNFVSKAQTPEAGVPGLYTATITNTRNGCSSTKSLSVSQDITPPSNVSAKVSDTLDCSAKTAKLMGASETKNVLFKWDGPHDFSSTEQTPETSFPGKYMLTVTNPLNGCISTATSTLIKEECPD